MFGILSTWRGREHSRLNATNGMLMAMIYHEDMYMYSPFAKKSNVAYE
jgi:hypothetical protein